MIDELEWVKRERPDVDSPSPEARTAALAALESAIEADRRGRQPRLALPPRAPVRWLAPAVGLLAVVAVAAVFLSVRHQGPAGAAGRGGPELVFRAEPKAPHRVLDGAALARAVAIIRAHIDTDQPRALGRVSLTSAGNDIIVRLRRGTGISRAQLLTLLDTIAPLTFYDWEANALMADGKPVASSLPTGNANALEISQGSAVGAPGSPGAGSMPLYQAVLVASRQPKRLSPENSRVGPEYFAFGATGSPACIAAARLHLPAVNPYHSTGLIPHSPCYLSGPSATVDQVMSALPPGVPAGAAQVFAVQQGTVILQAVPANYAHAPAWSSPSAQFYVLRDHPSLLGDEVTNPRPSTDQSGLPDVGLDFTAGGASAFHTATAAIAHRGAEVSRLGQHLDQHFAIAIDDQLLTVPSINYMTYPDGIQGQSADVVGGLTASSARSLASLIRLGSLPVVLTLVGEKG